MKRLLIIVAVCFLPMVVLVGQNKGTDDEYSRFAAQYNADMKGFRDSYNAEFSSFVSQYWKEFELFKAKSQFSKPKPKEPTVAKELPKEVKDNELKVEIKQMKAPQTNSAMQYVKEDEVKTNSNVESYSITFCDEVVPVRISKDMIIGLKDISESSVGEAWEKMSKADYLSTVYDCQSAYKRLALNDWGYFLFIKQIANALFKGKPNEAAVFTLFMMNQSGYDMRIGRINGNELSLLAAFVQDVYELPYIESDGKTYYILLKNRDINSISTYNKSFVAATHTFDLKHDEPFKLGDNVKSKVYNNDFGSNISIDYNSGDISLYKAYPQCSLSVSCKAPMSSTAELSLRRMLEPRMEGLCQLEKVNLVLEFIQAMPYKTDEEQFGYEKYFFPEEVFYYPYCDCEDRSALFRWIVSNIVGLEVINLEYDDHVSAAVKFTEPVNGDYISFKGGKYVICDPTYIGAPAGLSMPQYKNVAAKIIE